MRPSGLSTRNTTASAIISHVKRKDNVIRNKDTSDIYRWVHADAYVHIVIMLRYVISQVWENKTLQLMYICLTMQMIRGYKKQVEEILNDRKMNMTNPTQACN